MATVGCSYCHTDFNYRYSTVQLLLEIKCSNCVTQRSSLSTEKNIFKNSRPAVEGKRKLLLFGLCATLRILVIFACCQLFVLRTPEQWSVNPFISFFSKDASMNDRLHYCFRPTPVQQLFVPISWLQKCGGSGMWTMSETKCWVAAITACVQMNV